MKVQYFGGRKQIPSKGMVIKNGDILDWEGPLVMGMVPIKSSASPDKETTKISDVGETDPRGSPVGSEKVEEKRRKPEKEES